MCCLFGMVNYSGKAVKNADDIINCLAQEATIRGMDSTGIAYNKSGKLKIYKKPLSAYELEFKGLSECVCVTGHTRHATQGSHKLNYNNHPFLGYCDNAKFALAHNGVLWNDSQLRRKYNLPNDRIKTDSYIAVQLLEHFNTLNFANIAKMAEAVSGSFTFSMVDTDDNLWIVKGDNPLALYHFPRLKLYVYASTTQILFTALCRTDLCNEIASGYFNAVCLSGGDIAKIDKHGQLTCSTFKFDKWGGYGYDWRTYNEQFDDETEEDDEAIDYIEELKMVARSMGISDSEIEELRQSGFTYDEIEDFIYTGGW